MLSVSAANAADGVSNANGSTHYGDAFLIVFSSNSKSFYLKEFSAESKLKRPRYGDEAFSEPLLILNSGSVEMTFSFYIWTVFEAGLKNCEMLESLFLKFIRLKILLLDCGLNMDAGSCLDNFVYLLRFV